KVDGDVEGTTDSNGKLTFTRCGETVIITVSKSGYTYDYTSATLASCSLCSQPSLECTSNSECNTDEFCSNNVCEQITGTCGYALDHTWVSYQCCSDSMCGTNEVCTGHTCVQETIPECTVDSDCADDSICVDGSCKPLVGCGEIKNHTITLYHCGLEEGCPICPIGDCINHVCFVGGVTCDSGKVGEEKNCDFTQDQTPCSFCDYQLTDPTGKITTGKTDQDGKLGVPLTNEGIYQVALLKDGQVIKTTNLVALSKSPGGEPGKQVLADLVNFIWIPVLLLLICVFAYIVLGHMAKKPTKK
ncbi:MAG: hypothetical protein ABID61_00525, partial [Candidatus Micrarchaeota archaeon]